MDPLLTLLQRDALASREDLAAQIDITVEESTDASARTRRMGSSWVTTPSSTTKKRATIL